MPIFQWLYTGAGVIIGLALLYIPATEMWFVMAPRLPAERARRAEIAAIDARDIAEVYSRMDAEAARLAAARVAAVEAELAPQVAVAPAKKASAEAAEIAVETPADEVEWEANRELA